MATIKALSRLSDMDGVRVGHYTDSGARTGCTAIIFDKPAVASVHSSGGAPGTCETDLLKPSALVSQIDALLLTGGSAFGLSAVTGVRKYLEEKGRGFKAANFRVPIVPSAVIFDLSTGDGSIRPREEDGYMACVDAESPKNIEGQVGAGTGATVGKYCGLDKSSTGGLSSRMVKTPAGFSIGAIMVANCFGSVIDSETGKVIAGPKDETGQFLDYLDTAPPPPDFGNTAIGVVVTDAALSKGEAERVAIMAHDGIARAVAPSHTMYDGDTIFVVSIGDRKENISQVGAWGAKLVEKCIVEAVS